MFRKAVCTYYPTTDWFYIKKAKSKKIAFGLPMTTIRSRQMIYRHSNIPQPYGQHGSRAFN